MCGISWWIQKIRVEKVAGFCQNTSTFTKYLDFLGSSTDCNVVPVKFVEFPNYSGSSYQFMVKINVLIIELVEYPNYLGSSLPNWYDNQ